MARAMSIRIDYCADLRRSLSNSTAFMVMSKKPSTGRGWSLCGRIRRIWGGCMVGIDIWRLHHHHHLVEGDRMLGLSHGDSRAWIQGRSIKAQMVRLRLIQDQNTATNGVEQMYDGLWYRLLCQQCHPPPSRLKQQHTTADSSHRPLHQIKHQAVSHGLDLHHGADRRAFRLRSGWRTHRERRKDSRGRSRDCRHPRRPEITMAQPELRKTYCSRSSRDIDDRQWE